MDFFLTLLLAFVLAIVFGKIAKRLGLARIAGYICAGLVLSHPLLRSVLFDEKASSAFGLISDFGILLLFFFAGLEISIPQFKKNFKESFLISLLNTLLPFLVITWFCLAIGLGFNTAIVLGMILSVSAQAVIVDVLDELGLLKDKLGILVLSAGSVDDMVELFLLTVVLGFVGLSSGAMVFQIILNLLLFVFIVVSAKLWVVPYFFRTLAPTSAPEALFGASLAVALLMGVLSNFLGFGVTIGAVVSGILVRHILSIDQRKPWEEHKISNDIHLIGFGFFVPLFFVWAGFNTNLGVAFSQPFLVLSLFLISFFFGTLGSYVAVRLNRGTSLESMLVAMAMATKGDVELAVGLIALKAGVISVDFFSTIVLIALMSSILPIMIFRHFIKQYIEKKNPFFSMAKNVS